VSSGEPVGKPSFRLWRCVGGSGLRVGFRGFPGAQKRGTYGLPGLKSEAWGTICRGEFASQELGHRPTRPLRQPVSPLGMNPSWTYTARHLTEDRGLPPIHDVTVDGWGTRHFRLVHDRATSPFAFAAFCNTLHAAFALATPAGLRFAALSAELHPLFGALIDWPAYHVFAKNGNTQLCQTSECT